MILPIRRLGAFGRLPLFVSPQRFQAHRRKRDLE